MIVRKIDVALDDVGTVVRIGAHLFGQIEAFSKAEIDKGEDGATKAGRAIRQFVADALNNALSAAEWTEERVAQEFDQLSIVKIFEAALKHDGLKVAEPQQDPPAAA